MREGRWGWPWLRLAGASSLALLLCAGCVRLGPFGRRPQPPAGERTVRLDVIRVPGGSVLALLPVTIEGQGPFRFALDTGASRTMVSSDVAKRLKLRVVGRTTEVIGIVAAREADQVRIERWRAGNAPLPALTAVSLPLPRGPGGITLFDGLLGSDVLSRFGSVTVDYEGERLLLRPCGPQPDRGTRLSSP